MDIQQDHKLRKMSGYWSNLVAGDTGVYKAEVIDALVSEHGPAACRALLDIGCGTSAIAQTLRSRYPGCRLVCMDYDSAVVERMRAESADPTVEWRVADIFRVDEWDERFDLVLLLDMLHEVYSFYGRDDGPTPGPIDHARGLDATRRALAAVAGVVAPDGGIVITDNVLSPEAGDVTIRLREPGRLRPILERFVAEYPSRRIALRWRDDDSFVIPSHDFCILTTQYNKLSTNQPERWNVEKLEIHQYMTVAEYHETFASLGFTCHAVVGTPEAARAEWAADFEMIAGAAALPEKRVTLIAVNTEARS